MPTSAHETPLELLRLDPALPDWVQAELLGDDAPAFDHARLHDSNVRPHTFQADAMVLFCGADDNRPTRSASPIRQEPWVRGTVYEVQRGRDLRKLGSWKLPVDRTTGRHTGLIPLVAFV